jgi:hypothetical protein
MIFGFLGLANLAQDDVLQFHPFAANDKTIYIFLSSPWNLLQI